MSAPRGTRGKRRRVALEQPALRGQEARQLLELRAAERGIQVRQPVVESDLVVAVLPAMRHFGGGREVLGGTRKLCIVGEDRAAAAGGDGLVAVETERAKQSEGAGVAPRIVLPSDSAASSTSARLKSRATASSAVEIDRMTEDVHRHERANARPVARLTQRPRRISAATAQIFAQRARVDAERALLAVHKMGRAPQ